jgi:asparagine synthase (glutamine-hydrolysing)
MSKAIAHRGPDDDGYVLIARSSDKWLSFGGARNNAPVPSSGRNEIEADLGLVHRRFSIIDLSSNGHQPFFDRDRSCCVVFNGEIYNYVELRDQLIKETGASFTTESDTEVLVEAYKHWGEACFSRFNGFWALALYDFRTRRLLLSRDRIGKKPLFWTRQGDRIYFASEIKALLTVPEVHGRRALNSTVAATWLSFGKKDLDDNTFFEGIYALPAASYAYVGPDLRSSATRYWSLPTSRLTERDLSATEAASTLRETLQSAVALRMRADVPVAVELSGGLDSSTLAALTSRASSTPVKAFTVRFPQEEWNEEPYAAAVAQALNLEYHVLDLQVTDFWTNILPFTYLEEEPYHSPNLYINQMVWARMRDEGIKVSINGAAGDEVLAGYAKYYGPCQRELLLQGRFREYLSNAAGHTESSNRLAAYIRPLPRLLGLKRPHRTPLEFGQQAATLNQPALLSGLLAADMTRTLMPYWMTSGDRGFMGVPVEVRAPFLDYRVVETAFRLPIQYLIRDGWHKWVLRKAMEDALPEKVLWRRRRLGFPFPIEDFYSENRAIFDHIFASANNRFLKIPDDPQLRRDWRLVSFLLWYELFFNENYALFEKIAAMSQAKGPPRRSAANVAYLSGSPSWALEGAL